MLGANLRAFASLGVFAWHARFAAVFLPLVIDLQPKQVERHVDRPPSCLMATRLVPANTLMTRTLNSVAEKSMAMACLVAVVQRAPSGLV